MIYIALSIFVASLLFVVFKLFDVFKIDTLQAIVVNYVFAFLVAVFVSDIHISLQEIPSQPWFLGGVFLGFLFITVFQVMAITAQKNGLSVASIAGKMSVVIPIIFGIFWYKESVGVIKIIGILLAVIAVYLASAKNDTGSVKTSSLVYPILLFFGSGTIDTTLKFVEKKYVPESNVPLFLATIFGFAFVFGFLFLMYQVVIGKFKFQLKNLVAGFFLGIVNYYSMEFLLKAFKTDIESSTLFTINNVGVVILTTVFGVLLFKEKLIAKNWIGIAMAIVGILLVSFS